MVRPFGDGSIRFADVPVAGAAVAAANGADVIVGHTDADGYATLDVHAIGVDAEVTVCRRGAASRRAITVHAPPA
jgi:hypothetical protein